MQGSGQLSREYGAQVPSSSYSSLNHKVVQEQFSSPPNNNESILKTEDVYQIGQKRKVSECYIPIYLCICQEDRKIVSYDLMCCRVMKFEPEKMLPMRKGFARNLRNKIC